MLVAAGGGVGAPGTAASAAAATGPLTVRVVANGETAGRAPGPSIDTGATVTWSYRVTNSGSSGLWALYMWHDGIGAAQCPNRFLAPGETVRCSGSSTASPGGHALAVTAWAWDDAGAEAVARAVAHYVGTGSGPVGTPALDLEAFVAGQDADTPPGVVAPPGTPLSYRYRVRNTGDVPLVGVWVYDEAFGAVTCPTRRLAPGEEMTCRARRQAEEGLRGWVAQVHSWDSTGMQATDRDSLNYLGADPAQGVAIEALVEGFDGDTPPGPRVHRPGETIEFTYVVVNTGGLPLSTIRVFDQVLGAVTCAGSTLDPGEMMTCDASAVARLGEFSSQGRVTARAGAAVLRDSDPIYYHVREEPRIHHLALAVTVDGRATDNPPGPGIAAGQSVRLVYAVTYTGNNIVYNVTIQDPFVPGSDLSCNGDRILSAGESLVCSATVTAAPGQYAATVTAVSWDANGRRVTAEDHAYYFGMA
jgi:uncharacterized repeat protein (TIGR01451 family)